MPAPSGFSVNVNAPFNVTMERTRAALKAEGFGVLTEIDIQATFKEKLGHDFRRYTILGACNPPLAWTALNASAEVGLLLPCNVTVEEGEGDTTVVRLVDPIQMLAGDGSNPAITDVAHQAQARLERVAVALAKAV